MCSLLYNIILYRLYAIYNILCGIRVRETLEKHDDSESFGISSERVLLPFVQHMHILLSSTMTSISSLMSVQRLSAEL